LTLEHLRAVERYGVTTEQQEQYTGWMKLPAASVVDEAAECAKILIGYASIDTEPSKVTSDQKVFDQVWREAVRRTHPDQNPGQSGTNFNNAITTRDRLKKLKGWA
ncbi:MAG TPA: hypothetical protein VJ302_30200, partial [Blastocatellia bacterium]|nr:hypothetical protein [Blastocatellia bacterium]